MTKRIKTVEEIQKDKEETDHLFFGVVLVLVFIMNEIALYMNRFTCVDSCVSAMPVWCLVLLLFRPVIIVLLVVLVIYHYL